MNLLRIILLRFLQLPLQARLAARNVRRQRSRTLLTMFSMAGGFIVCAVSISIQYGSYGSAVDTFVRDQTGHLQVFNTDYLERPRIHKLISDPETVRARVAAHPAVVAATPRVFAPALAYSIDNKSAPAQVVGVDVENERLVTSLARKVTTGTYLSEQPNEDGYHDVLIGVAVSTLLDIQPGDEITLVGSGAGGSIAHDLFIVRGITGTPRSRDRFNVYLPLGVAQEFLRVGDRAHQLAVAIDDVDDSVAVSRELQAELQAPFTVEPWERVEAAFYSAMRSEMQRMYVTLAILIFLVCVGVLNTVLMSVFERTREFGALRAVGTRPLNITVMILLENALLAIYSCVVALLVTLPLISYLAFVGIELETPVTVGGVIITHLQGEMSAEVFTTPMLFVIATAILVSFVPAVRAARITPLAALGSH